MNHDTDSRPPHFPNGRRLQKYFFYPGLATALDASNRGNFGLRICGLQNFPKKQLPSPSGRSSGRPESGSWLKIDVDHTVSLQTKKVAPVTMVDANFQNIQAVEK